MLTIKELIWDIKRFYIYKFNKLRGVAQLGARVVWDHEVAGSIPVTPTIFKYNMRVLLNGRVLAFQASYEGSIPSTRSKYAFAY